MTSYPHQELARLSEAAIKSGSKSFAAASKLFDRETRASVHLLYAWCRHCDDMIDGQAMGYRMADASMPSQTEALARLRDETARALNGVPSQHPVFQGLHRVADVHEIPHAHFFELLDGFAMDVAGRSYATLGETLDYCYHVAGVVGVMMSMIMGAREDDTLDRAAELGIAFQLTNIARDVVEDAQADRVYLPHEWLRAAGVTPQSVADPHHRVAVFQVVQRLLAVAEQFYEASAVGISRLPARSAWAVETARIVYRQIGREVLMRGPSAWDGRVSTSSAQKVAAVGRGALSLAMMHTWGHVSPSEQTLWHRARLGLATGQAKENIGHARNRTG